MIPRTKAGFTIVEAVVATAIAGIVLLSMAQLTTPVSRYFMRSGPRQQANLELRSCLETIERIVGNGRAGTVQLAPTPYSTVFSSMTFQSLNGVTTSLYWSPDNTVHLQRSSGAITQDSVLAHHIVSLGFQWDPQNPSLMQIVLRLRAPLDTAGRPDSYLDIVTPPTLIRMADH